MPREEERILSRDCQATVVPSGESVTIPEGSKVNITHQLGGNFTVVWDYGMARIESANADALGEEVINGTHCTLCFRGAPGCAG